MWHSDSYLESGMSQQYLDVYNNDDSPIFVGQYMGGSPNRKDNDEDADEDKGSTSFTRATQLPGFERSTVFQVRFQCKPRVKLF